MARLWVSGIHSSWRLLPHDLLYRQGVELGGSGALVLSWIGVHFIFATVIIHKAPTMTDPYPSESLAELAIQQRRLHRWYSWYPGDSVIQNSALSKG